MDFTSTLPLLLCCILCCISSVMHSTSIIFPLRQRMISHVCLEIITIFQMNCQSFSTGLLTPLQVHVHCYTVTVNSLSACRRICTCFWLIDVCLRCHCNSSCHCGSCYLHLCYSSSSPLHLQCLLDKPSSLHTILRSSYSPRCWPLGSSSSLPLLLFGTGMFVRC